jgi:hypothetical protein
VDSLLNMKLMIIFNYFSDTKMKIFRCSLMVYFFKLSFHFKWISDNNVIIYFYFRLGYLEKSILINVGIKEESLTNQVEREFVENINWKSRIKWRICVTIEIIVWIILK